MKPIPNLVAVWGSSGTGKTATSLKLALSLLEENRSVLLLFPDDTTPTIPCLYGERELTKTGSLGSLFIAPRITSTLVSYHLTLPKDIQSLAFLGFEKGEHRYRYPTPTTTQCSDILRLCSELADILLVDIPTGFSRDMLSTVALLRAGVSLRLETLDIKNVSYLSSSLPLLQSHSQYKSKRELRILNDVHHTPKAVLKKKKEYDTLLPYCAELSQHSRHGTLLQNLTARESDGYKRSIKTLTQTILRKVDAYEKNDAQFL